MRSYWTRLGEETKSLSFSSVIRQTSTFRGDPAHSSLWQPVAMVSVTGCRVIPSEAGRKLAGEWSASFVESSAKQNEVRLGEIVIT